MADKFYTRRFYLDNIVNQYVSRGSDHFVGAQVKSFWVSKVKSNSFKASIVVNPGPATGVGIPLRYNQCQNFEKVVDNLVVRVDEEQPGEWIEITFSPDEEMNVGSIAIEQTGETTLTEGTSHRSSKVTITSSISELITSDDSRSNANVQWKSGGSIWIGNNTSSELQHADYQTICTEILPGQPIPWKNKGSLFARTASGSAVFSLFEELK